MNKTDVIKTFNYMKRNGIRRTWTTVRERLSVSYGAGYEYRIPSADELRSQRETASKRDHLISIVVPVYETPEGFLTELLTSVIAQSDPHWELILADAGKSSLVEDTVKAFLLGDGKAYASQIVYRRLSENRGIAENTNAALAFASGDYVGLLDHDDLLTPDAIFRMQEAIGKAGASGMEPQLLYSDEDKYDGDADLYYDPNIKSEFDIDLLMSNNYICHFSVFRSDLIRELKLRSDFDGAQDHDLLLRAAARILERGYDAQSGLCDTKRGAAGAICHVPYVLYHWRCHSASTAANPASKRYAYEAGKRAVEAFIASRGWKANVQETAHVGFFRVVYGTGKDPEEIFAQRPNVAAIGGNVIDRESRIVSGKLTRSGQVVFQGLYRDYAGPCNLADVVSRAEALDARTMILREDLIDLFVSSVGVPYRKDPAERDIAYCNQLDEQIWRQRSLLLCEKLTAAGALLLWDPEVVVRR
ncbi:MAG: glycosyltransferase [Lachnospiraceae bacterium]|nr:glycosyltransferase [Lachnospiraceae bacterium]